MSTYRNDDEIVMVPVPKSQLRDVYRVLANPATKQDAHAQSEEVAEEAVEVYKQGTWTKSDVIRLEAELKNAAMRTFLSLLAEQVPKSWTFKEAVEATGMDTDLLRAQFGSLSKITKRLFGGPRPKWPMAVRYDERDAIYSMNPKIAEWWLEATGRRA